MFSLPRLGGGGDGGGHEVACLALVSLVLLRRSVSFEAGKRPRTFFLVREHNSLGHFSCMRTLEM